MMKREDVEFVLWALVYSKPLVNNQTEPTARHDKATRIMIAELNRYLVKDTE